MFGLKKRGMNKQLLRKEVERERVEKNRRIYLSKETITSKLREQSLGRAPSNCKMLREARIEQEKRWREKESLGQERES